MQAVCVKVRHRNGHLRISFRPRAIVLLFPMDLEALVHAFLHLPALIIVKYFKNRAARKSDRSASKIIAVCKGSHPLSMCIALYGL